MYLLLLNLLMGTPIDITQLPIQNEVYIVAIDVKVNPTNMPSAMLWDDPILLLYRQVSTFENIRADVVREELTQSYQSGMYQPVVLRTRQTESLTIHFMNLIGEGEAPVRIVQGPVCKSCPDAPETKAYTFSYGPQADQSQFLFLRPSTPTASSTQSIKMAQGLETICSMVPITMVWCHQVNNAPTFMNNSILQVYGPCMTMHFPLTLWGGVCIWRWWWNRCAPR